MKKIYSTICCCMLLLCSFSAVKAQDGFQPGFIILANGTRIAGAIKLRVAEPWINQRRIWFKDSASMATQKDVKPKKYTVDELKYFEVAERRFEKVHYVDMENLQIKSLGSNDHMLEKLSSGRINAYRFYQYAKDVDAFYGTEAEYKAYEAKTKSDLMMGFKFLTKKDNEAKFHDAFDYDLQILFEDTPEVLKKYQAGEYGNQPVSKKTGFMAKMIAQAKKRAYKPEEAQAIITAFDDYNQKNPMKQ